MGHTIGFTASQDALPVAQKDMKNIKHEYRKLVWLHSEITSKC